MNVSGVKVEIITADIVIIGGGTSGCFAAVTIKEANPSTDVLVIEKAHVKRSGCLAAGVNAINAYLNPGETPESYLEYVKRDSAGLVREDLVLSIGKRLNQVTQKLELWGLPFEKDAQGCYKSRGKRSIEIKGESIKPVIAAALYRSGARVMNRTAASNYIIKDGKAAGIFAFSTREKKFYVIIAKAVICTTGGASGIYRPNNSGAARHKMWYCPFNVGTGFAMGLRAGAEMTTFEMRFIALRIKDVLSPTGTITQGVKTRQVNAFDEEYLGRYGSVTTPIRLYATVEENKAGRGPCYLNITHLRDEDNVRFKRAYLNMSPGIILKWADEEAEPNSRPLEVCGSEPYIVGGHGQAGYWVDSSRRASIKGIFAAGDVAGGAPKKYVSGCFAEGEIAAQAALRYINSALVPEIEEKEIMEEIIRVLKPLERNEGFTPDDYEDRLQKIMDEYAGGISVNYELSEPKLLVAREMLFMLQHEVETNMTASNMHEVVKAHEVVDRVLVARVLVEHLLYRKETRWKSYQERLDYPSRDDKRWFTFINSVYDRKTENIHIIERPWKGKTEIERTD